VKDEDIVLFTRQMHTLLKAGVSLLTSLESVGEQTSSRILKDAIIRMKADVESGVSFSEALSKFPKIFSPLYINMVKTGEASGTLDEIMKRLAQMQEYDIDIKQKVKSATRYPIIAFVTLVIAFFVLVMFVVPRFATLFAQFKTALPLPTRMLLFIYKAVHDWWFVTLAVIACVIFAFIKFINTPAGRYRWDTFRIKVPVLGPLLFKIAMSRFAKTMSILISSGINMLQTLELSADTVGNVVIARAVRYIKDGVNEGKGLAGPMKVSKLFTPIVVQMVSIGEESGKLDELLVNVSEHYDQQVDYAMKNLATMIEPLLIFALGIMVLFVGLGVFLPMWNMIYLFRQ
jgi:type II secretory pathway component PulF